MKKITRFAVAAALALTMMFTIVACAEPTPEAVGTKTGTAYGIVHKKYVGVITVTTDLKDNVTNVDIDEAFLPIEYARVEKGEDFDAPVVSYTTTTAPITTTTWAKHISVNGKMFTAAAITGDAKTPTYKSGDDESVAYVTANAKAYVEGILAGTVFVSDAGGANKGYANYNGSPFKSNGLYWSAGGNGMGWKANMAKLSAHFVKNGFNFTDADISPIGEDKKNPGTIGGVATGSTLADFADYVKLAKKAFDARA